MRNYCALLIAALLTIAGSGHTAAQEYQPKSIQFRGAPEYTETELLAAAQLKLGMSLSVDAMKDHAKVLMDSGVFESITFQFTGVDLRYIMTPSTSLVPIKLANIPLAAGADLDAQLHDRVPLYHGKVPAEGGLTDQVRMALEQILAAKGIKANVEAVATASQSPASSATVIFSIASPPVVVGEMGVDSKSPALEPGATQILKTLAGTPYDLEGTSSRIATYLENYYRDKGYIEVHVEAAPKDPVTAAEFIQVPFQLSFAPGIQYKLDRIRLAPDLVVTQAHFDEQANIHPGDFAEGQRLTEEWQFIVHQFHNHGYMQATVHPKPSFDRAKGTVSYDVTVEPGPAYSMGSLTIENVSDDLRAAMLAAWKMPAGAVFNEAAVVGFFGAHDANPALGRVFAAVNINYTPYLNNDLHIVDVVLRLEKKH